MILQLGHKIQFVCLATLALVAWMISLTLSDRARDGSDLLKSCARFKLMRETSSSQSWMLLGQIFAAQIHGRQGHILTRQEPDGVDFGVNFSKRVMRVRFLETERVIDDCLQVQVFTRVQQLSEDLRTSQSSQQKFSKCCLILVHQGLSQEHARSLITSGIGR